MRKRYLILSIVFFVLFLLLTLAVKKRLVVDFDFSSTIKIQQYIPPFIDPFLSFFSLFGSFEILTLFLVIFILVTGKKRNFLVLVFFIIGHFVEILGKSLLVHPGPPFRFFRYNLDFLFPSAYIQASSSFPSGHSFRTVFLAVIFVALILGTGFLSRRKKELLVLVIMILTLVMLVSRVSLGEHWLSDVLGGTFLGLSYAFLSLIFI